MDITVSCIINVSLCPCVAVNLCPRLNNEIHAPYSKQASQSFIFILLLIFDIVLATFLQMRTLLMFIIKSISSVNIPEHFNARSRVQLMVRSLP